MHGNSIRITKNDVQVGTNGKCVDIRVAPYDQKDKHARVVTVTLERDTAIRLREALDAYLALDRTM